MCSRFSLVLLSIFFFLMIPRHPSSTLFPYTTLFRSGARRSKRASVPARIESFSPASLPTTRISRPTFARSGLRGISRSEEHTSELQSRVDLVCRLLLEKKKEKKKTRQTHLQN